MSSELTGALVAAGAAVLVAPYLARLTLSVPDRTAARWWRGRPASPARVGVTALLATVLGALGGLAAATTAVLPAFVLLAVVGAPLVVIDYEHHRLPNRLVFALVTAAPPLALLAAGPAGEWSWLLRAAEGAAAVFAVLFLLVFLAPRSFGYGDVKLGGVLGGYLGWFGWAQVYYGIFGGFLLGAVVSLALLAGRRATMKTAIPFGPMLLLGALLVLAFDLTPDLG
ncbi:leader peptidase (prepilin peptidase) / N-methyltransferase [Jatrophihabitans endophyticus]|uniref:Leader peptidase (Prepilin peptidase) / N-methyltransferase n=1 Tax=Jatrophihabitans endophyticus TaxID=1206085 RepID=A0A1M5LMR6_9ACTN|nr:prepilin peptidase [Jatrophihabitans endophyticus]SHG66200.1 leader peptidase (prepilin peptidase) / N-methyltransferase [Jatrophihabitans endophyticus]